MFFKAKALYVSRERDIKRKAGVDSQSYEKSSDHLQTSLLEARAVPVHFVFAAFLKKEQNKERKRRTRDSNGGKGVRSIRKIKA